MFAPERIITPFPVLVRPLAPLPLKSTELTERSEAAAPSATSKRTAWLASPDPFRSLMLFALMTDEAALAKVVTDPSKM